MSKPDEQEVYGDTYLDAIKKELEQGRRQWKRGDKLLEAFGYVRRRQTAIDLINSRLKLKGMSTTPLLTTEMPLDRGITFQLKNPDRTSKTAQNPVIAPGTLVEEIELADNGSGRETVTIPQEPPVVEPGEAPDRKLIVGNLDAADRAPLQIKPDATLREAFMQMALHDYSQLPVTTSPREIKGMVSYRSIAQAFLLRSPKSVNDCIESAKTVRWDESLFAVVDLLKEFDAILVVKADRTLGGIVTAADIAAEFRATTGPFLMIGQIEEQLRWLVQIKLDMKTALEAVGLPASGSVPKTTDLTMGDLHRILVNERNWSRIGIKFDRVLFCQELDEVREIRNEIMHFRDPPTAEATERIRRFANVVQMAWLAAR